MESRRLTDKFYIARCVVYPGMDRQNKIWQKKKTRQTHKGIYNPTPGRNLEVLTYFLLITAGISCDVII